MQRVIVASIVLAMAGTGSAARTGRDTRGEQLFAQARAALGGDATLGRIHALTAAGSFQREMGDRQISGEVTIDLQLPDKMLRTESMRPMGDTTIEMLQGINGDRVLRHSRTLGGGNVMMRMTAPAGPEAEAQDLRNQRADFARFALAFLLTSVPAVPLEYTYGGEAESDDGKADVVDVQGPAGFAARLFLDKKSHRPLMLSYRGLAPRMVVQTQRQGGQAPAAGEPPSGPPSAAAVDIQLFLDDYKAVDGVMFPHHLSRSIDGKPSDETTFRTIVINPSFKPDTFTTK